MQRKRDGLGSIGEVFSGPSRLLKKALRSASPQARHHFNLTDQVNQLVGASEADPDMGFMARMLALCSLPRLLLAWVCTEAVRTQARKLVLGASLSGLAPLQWTVSRLSFSTSHSRRCGNCGRASSSWARNSSTRSSSIRCRSI